MSTTPTHKSSIEGEVEYSSDAIEEDSEPYTKATFIDVKQVLHEIKGVAHLPNLIAMCDTVDSKLMIFDTDFNLRFEHTCPMLPFDVCALNDTTVVVSSISKCWSLFSIGADKMYCIERIGTAGRCYGICCHKWEIFCIVGEKSSHRRRLNVYAADGRLKRYKYLEDGNQVFDQSEYIGINAKTDILYVSDLSKGVLALSLSGDVISVIPLPQLECRAGIAVDGHGQVYVCGWRSGNVIQMSSDGQNVIEMMSGNKWCKYPQSVKIHDNKMFVIGWKSNKLLIFELA